MAEIVNIASLTINIDDVIKESVRLQKQVDSIKASQKDLDRTTEEGEAAYQKLDAQLKNTKKSLRDNQNLTAALDSANSDLNKTLQIEGKSTQELYDSRRQLNQIAKNITGNTEEEIALRDQLNTAIDGQTKALREQQSEFNSSKDKIGEYTQGINASDLSLLSMAKASEEAGGAANLLKGGLSATATGFKSATKASLAFIATPVGAILAAIITAFYLVKNAMNLSEKSTNRIKRAFSAFSGIANGLLKFLQPLGDFLIDGLVKGFELVETGLYKALNAIEKGLRFLGLDKAADSMKGFTEEVQASVQAEKELTDAELALTKAQRESRKTQLQYQKDAEVLRQIRDDENRSIEERIKANEELGKVLNKQLEDELALAQKALDLAKLKIQIYGETEDNLNALADAETEILDIEERITGQASEQLTNRVSLQKEAADAIAEIQAKEAEDAKELAEQKAEAAKKAAEAAVEAAQFELNEYVRANKSKLDSDKFLTEQALAEEEKRLEGLAEQRRQFEAVKLEEGKISQVEYNDAIAQINEENQAAIDEARKARKEAEAEQAAIDADNALQLLQEQGNNEFLVYSMQLERDRQQEIAEAEKTGANVALIEKKYAERRKNLDNEVSQAKLQGFQSVFASYASILGEQTKAGKAAAIASTTIATYQSATEAYKSLAGIPIVGVGLGIAAAAAAIVAGLSNVRKIASTSEKYSAGDILKGRSHASGGIPFSIGGMLGFEAEGGEALINKRSTSMFRPLLSAINEAGGGKKFASGGIAGSTSGLPSSALIDYDLLASRISQANENLPSPVVSVEEINTVNSNVSVVESLATT